ncbi:hypothetical protein AAZF84_17510 [Bacillus sp. JR_15]
MSRTAPAAVSRTAPTAVSRTAPTAVSHAAPTAVSRAAPTAGTASAAPAACAVFNIGVMAVRIPMRHIVCLEVIHLQRLQFIMEWLHFNIPLHR